MILQPKCSFLTQSGRCAHPTVTVELVPPGELPTEYDKWDPDRKKSFDKRPEKTYLKLYQSMSGSSGWGLHIDENEVNRIMEMFSLIEKGSGELDIDQFNMKFSYSGLCRECKEFYCSDHWSISSIGLGTCPNKHEQVFNPYYWDDV